MLSVQACAEAKGWHWLSSSITFLPLTRTGTNGFGRVGWPASPQGLRVYAPCSWPSAGTYKYVLPCLDCMWVPRIWTGSLVFPFLVLWFLKKPTACGRKDQRFGGVVFTLRGKFLLGTESDFEVLISRYIHYRVTHYLSSTKARLTLCLLALCGPSPVPSSRTERSQLSLCPE